MYSGQVLAAHLTTLSTQPASYNFFVNYFLCAWQKKKGKQGEMPDEVNDYITSLRSLEDIRTSTIRIRKLNCACLARFNRTLNPSRGMRDVCAEYQSADTLS